MSRTASGAVRAAGGHAPRPSEGSFLSRHRVQVGLGAFVVLFVVTVLAWPALTGSRGRSESGAAPVTQGRAVIPTIAPNARVPAGAATQPPAFVPATMQEREAIELIGNRSINGADYTSMFQRFAQWSAEYRGDGSWIVHADEAAWLIFEDSRQVMPVNINAINVETQVSRTQSR